MRKGVSQIIVIILLVMISVTLVSSLFLWASSNTFNIFPEEEQNISYLRSRACLNIDDIVFRYSDLKLGEPTCPAFTGDIILRNCGYVPISDFKLYINSVFVESTFQDKLEPSETGIMEFTDPCSGDITFRFLVVSDLAESQVITK
jgi:hypothetical protein